MSDKLTAEKERHGEATDATIEAIIAAERQRCINRVLTYAALRDQAASSLRPCTHKSACLIRHVQRDTCLRDGNGCTRSTSSHVVPWTSAILAAVKRPGGDTLPFAQGHEEGGTSSKGKVA